MAMLREKEDFSKICSMRLKNAADGFLNSHNNETLVIRDSSTVLGLVASKITDNNIKLSVTATVGYLYRSGARAITELEP